MARFSLTLAALFGMALSPAHSQDPNEPGPRYVPIPFQGNFEALFKARLQAAEEDESLRNLLNLIRQDPQKFNLDQARVNQLDLENPALRRMFRDMMEKHQAGAKLTPADLAGLKKTLDKVSQPKGTGRVPSLPKEAGDRPLPRQDSGSPARISKPSSDPLDRWMGDWVRNAEASNLGDWLRDSPAFQKGLGDLKTLIDLDKRPSIWGLENLPDHLRLTDKLNLGIGDRFLDRLKNISIPDMPRVNMPRLNLGNWNLPSVPLPNLGRPGGANVGESLLWAMVVVVAVILAWQIAKNLHPRSQTRLALARLGPWPVDPAQVATRSQLIQAFDYLAVLLLGTSVRSWNHRAIARKLAGATDQCQAVEELTLLYELARYTTGPDALSAHDQGAVRRDLCLLAGVASA